MTRYTGANGKRLLLEALKEQRLVAHSEEIASELASVAQVVDIPANEEIISQGGTDNDICLILMGSFSIRVNQREIAVRRAASHVGEMALLDPGAKRSASVVAIEDSSIARIQEADFAAIAAKYPLVWRRIAREMSERLRERGRYVKAPNPRPVIFIGASTEGLYVAEKIQQGLSHVNAVVRIFTNDVFIPSHGTMEDLEDAIGSSDFAVLVMTPDDHIENERRKINQDAPRDNVIFELGMSFGAISRYRTFFVTPRGVEMKIPSDLLGITPITYVANDAPNLSSHLGPVVTAIKDAVGNMGVR